MCDEVDVDLRSRTGGCVPAVRDPFSLDELEVFVLIDETGDVTSIEFDLDVAEGKCAWYNSNANVDHFVLHRVARLEAPEGLRHV